MRPPSKWYGGKQRLAKWIVSFFPPHELYVEPFGGMAACLFAKRRGPGREVYNDIDEGLVNFFRVLRDPAASRRLMELLELTPYSRAEYLDCRATWDEQQDTIEKARKWFVTAAQSFGARWRSGWGQERRYPLKRAPGWPNMPKRLMACARRFQGVHVECDTWQACIERFDHSTTLFYCDPPYLHCKRWDSDHGYRSDMEDTEHEVLLERLQAVQGMVLLSGYPSELYDACLADWVCLEKQVMVGANNRTVKPRHRTECLWLNPAVQDGLSQGSLFIKKEADA